MNDRPVSRQLEELLDDYKVLMDFERDEWEARRGDPGICDFAFGNPNEMPLAQLTEAIRAAAVPQTKDWFAYKLSEPQSQRIVASSLRERYGIDFDPLDIAMTSGAFPGLALALRVVLDPTDEAIVVLPPWFFYEGMIKVAGGVPVTVRAVPPTFDLPLDQIAAAISPRTRAIIVNSPNNPTGRIYPEENIQGLVGLLTEASERNQRRIYLISDESYSRIVFDGRKFMTPCAYYPNTFLVYTFGKTLLSPGERLGYVAMPPEMAGREALRDAFVMAQITGGWLFANSVLQHALSEIDPLSISIEHLQQKRDRIVGALTEIGYEVHKPEGTFYVLVRSPIPDDVAFMRSLAARDVLVLPGATFQYPGWFRLSVTASDEMIERSIPAFELALKEATGA